MACMYTGEPCAFPDSEESCMCCSGCHVINCKKCQKSEQHWYAGMPYFVCLKTGKKLEALNDICSSFRGNCMLCAHVEKPDDTERYWYYKCKLKKQKPIDEYGHIDPTKAKICDRFKNDGTYEGWEAYCQKKKEQEEFDRWCEEWR